MRTYYKPGASLVGQQTKNPPANAANVRDTVQSRDREDPQEEGMGSHSSSLAQSIPRTEDPGGLWPTGLQRVRHD